MPLVLLLGKGVNAQHPKAVSLGDTPDSAMAFLKGYASFDSLSKNYISYKWYLQSGQQSGINIVSANTTDTKVRGLVPGTYQFGFVVTDNRIKKSDTAYTTIVVHKP